MADNNRADRLIKEEADRLLNRMADEYAKKAFARMLVGEFINRFGGAFARSIEIVARNYTQRLEP